MVEVQPRRRRVDVGRGFRRVLVVLAGVYWLAGGLIAFDAYGQAYRTQRDAIQVLATEADMSTALRRAEAAGATSDARRIAQIIRSPGAAGWKAAGQALAIEAGVFAVLSAIYLVLRWVVRGFIPKAEAAR